MMFPSRCTGALTISLQDGRLPDCGKLLINKSHRRTMKANGVYKVTFLNVQ